MQTKQTKLFLKGTVILSATALFVKILSALYRVPYQNVTLDQGYYIYQQVYPLYSFISTLGMYGFSAVLSQMLAQEGDKERRGAIKGSVFLAQIFVCFTLFIALLTLKQEIAYLLGDFGLQPIIEASAWLLCIIPFLSFLRGGFQSKGTMIPTSHSQVIEQLTRVVLIFIFLYAFIQNKITLYELATLSYMGAFIGALFATLFLVIIKRKFFSYTEAKQDGVWRIEWNYVKVFLYKVSFFVIGSAFLIFIQAIDAVTFVRGIYEHSSLSLLEAQQLKGIYDRLQPILQVALVIATSFTLAIVPFISLDRRSNQLDHAKEKSRIALKWSLTIGGAAAAGMMVVMKDINILLFSNDDGTLLLQLQSVSAFTFSFLLTGFGVLQGFEKEKMSAYIVIFASVIKLIGNVVFIKMFGVYGVIISTWLSGGIASILLYLYLKTKLKLPLHSKRMTTAIVLPILLFFIAALLQQLFTIVFPIEEHRIGHGLRILWTVIGSALIYFITLVKLDVFTRKEWSYIPFGLRFALWIQKNI